MKKIIYILLTAFVTSSSALYAQSQNPIDALPANVKMCNSTSPKRLKDMTFYKADGTNHQSFNYEYDIKGLLASETESIWDKNNNNWKNNSKITYSYDNQNRLVEKITSYYHSNNWYDNSKVLPVYNSDGLVTEESYFGWNSSENNWNQATFKYTYTYNSNGFRTEYFQQMKNTSEGDIWKNPNWKVMYTRNQAGQVIEEIGLNWNEDSLSWINECKYEFNYDAVNNRMSALYYIWKENQWVENRMTICIYDNDGDLERADYYKSFDESSLDAYCIYSYTTANVSPDPTGITEIVSDQMMIYPNPATAYFNLKVPSEMINKQANLYDSAGKLIKNIILENEVTRIDISQVPAGIYYIKAEDKTAKVIKR